MIHPLRILLFRPPYRRGEIYFRAQQTQQILEKDGHHVQVIAGKGWRSYLWALFHWPFLLKQSQMVFLYPHVLMFFYALTAVLLGRAIIIDHYVSYIRLIEAKWWGIFSLPFEKLTYRSVRFVLAHTHTVGTELHQTWQLSQDQVHTLYSVVDTNHFAPKYQKQAEQLRLDLKLRGQFVVFYHGLWHRWHGLDVLRAAVQRLVEAGEPVVLVLLGRVGQGHAHERWLDEVPYLALPAYIQLADVWCSGFVNLERGNRSFSSTMIQALAMARPVITSPSPEKNQYLQDSTSVIYVPPNDPRALSQAILACMKDHEKCQKIGQAGRYVAIQHFSEQHFAEFLRLVCETYDSTKTSNSSP